MRVLVDLDGVVADWGFEYDRQAEFYGLHSEGGVPYAQRPGWDLRAGLTPSGRAINSRIMEVPGFYRHLPVIEGAKEAIAELILDCHDVYFVSTPYRGNPSCPSDKYEWVREHFGQTMQTKTILTEHKAMVRGDILIDDRPEIANSEDAEWKHVCFGDYGYSQTTRAERVRNWSEALEAVALHQWYLDLMTAKMMEN